jgi:hypothetical protein
MSSGVWALGIIPTLKRNTPMRREGALGGDPQEEERKRRAAAMAQRAKISREQARKESMVPLVEESGDPGLIPDTTKESTGSGSLDGVEERPDVEEGLIDDSGLGRTQTFGGDPSEEPGALSSTLSSNIPEPVASEPEVEPEPEIDSALERFLRGGDLSGGRPRTTSAVKPEIEPEVEEEPIIEPEEVVPEDTSQYDNYKDMGGNQLDTTREAPQDMSEGEIDTYLDEIAPVEDMSEADMDTMMDEVNPLAVNSQRFKHTYDKEKGNGTDSLSLHHPTPESGVTIGAGYDMKKRDAATIKADLLAAGVSEEIAQAMSLGAGLSGADATTFKTDNKEHMITEEQRSKLFDKTSIAYEDMGRAKMGDQWETLSDAERDFVVGQTYNAGATWTSVQNLVNADSYDAGKMTQLLKNTKGEGISRTGVANNRVTAYNHLAKMKGWPTIVKATYNADNIDGKASYLMSDDTGTAFNVGSRTQNTDNDPGAHVYNF